MIYNNSTDFMYLQKIKQEAIELRKEGYSYNYIISKVPVAKSTLSEWFVDIPFTPNKHTIETIGNARIASGIYKHGVKVESLKKAKLQAVKDIGTLSSRDIVMLGLGLYIGEGGKTLDIVRIINSDPKVIRFALKWLQVSFGVDLKQIKVRLFLYPDSNQEESIRYWSKHLKISTDQFFKPTIDLRTNKKLSNKGKLPFGTAHISVKSFGNKKHGVHLHRVIMALINQVLC
jgi:hypothetical protein